MESVAKRHPVLTVLAVGLALWFALGYWARRKALHDPRAGSNGGAGGTPQTAGQKVASALNKAQDALSSACLLNPALCVLTPKVAVGAVKNAATYAQDILEAPLGGRADNLIHITGSPITPSTKGLSIADSVNFALGRYVVLPSLAGELPGIPAGAQINNKGDITFDGTASANYVAAWRSAGYYVSVDGNAITLTPAPAGSTVNLYAPPSAPAPKAA